MNDSDPDVAGWCARLRRIPAAVASDVLAAMGLHGQVIACALRPLQPSRAAFTGPALCFAGDDDRSRPPPASAPLVYETDRRIVPGCVVVLATGGHRVGAVLGGNTVTSWRRRGCVALVTDGLVRDATDFLDLPTFVAGVTPMNNQGRWWYRSLDAPATLPGQSGRDVVIEPGDVVHGDADGVVVVPRPHLAQLVEDAEVALAIEGRMRREIEADRDREAVYLGNDRFGHVRPAGRQCDTR